MNNDNSCILHEGFLDKKGRGHHFSFIRPWTNRYFMIDTTSNQMRYYKYDGHKYVFSILYS